MQINLKMFGLVLLALCIGCSTSVISGGGASETVAVSVFDNTISGKIITGYQQFAFNYQLKLYPTDFVPDGTQNDRMKEITIDNELVFSCTTGSGLYNLIITNVHSTYNVIFQEVFVGDSSKYSGEKELTQPGSICIGSDTLTDVFFFILGTPFFGSSKRNKTVNLEGIPAGDYEMMAILYGGRDSNPDVIDYKSFSIKSNKETFVDMSKE